MDKESENQKTIRLNTLNGFQSVKLKEDDMYKAIINGSFLYIRDCKLKTKTNNQELWVGITNHSFSNGIKIESETPVSFYL